MELGRPQLKLYLRHAGNFIPIGSVYNSGPLAAGTRLKLMAIGNTIAFMENGVQLRIAVADGTLTRGMPGIMAYGAAKGYRTGPEETPAISRSVIRAPTPWALSHIAWFPTAMDMVRRYCGMCLSKDPLREWLTTFLSCSGSARDRAARNMGWPPDHAIARRARPI